MKDIKYYKKLNYKMTFNYDPEDKIYVVQFPELPGCLAHGKTAKEALKNAERVKGEWLESAFDDKWIIPEPSLPLETTGRITLRIPKSIHQRIIDRLEEEDISQNQLILTYITEGLERNNLNNKIEDILQKLSRDIESIKKYEDSKIIAANSQIPYYLHSPTSNEDFNSLLLNKAFPQWCLENANKEATIKGDCKQKEDSAISDNNNLPSDDRSLNS